jgi:hypothetical protein
MSRYAEVPEWAYLILTMSVHLRPFVSALFHSRVFLTASASPSSLDASPSAFTPHTRACLLVSLLRQPFLRDPARADTSLLRVFIVFFGILLCIVLVIPIGISASQSNRTPLVPGLCLMR